MRLEQSASVNGVHRPPRASSPVWDLYGSRAAHPALQSLTLHTRPLAVPVLVNPAHARLADAWYTTISGARRPTGRRTLLPFLEFPHLAHPDGRVCSRLVSHLLEYLSLCCRPD